MQHGLTSHNGFLYVPTQCPDMSTISYSLNIYKINVRLIIPRFILTICLFFTTRSVNLDFGSTFIFLNKTDISNNTMKAISNNIGEISLVLGLTLIFIDFTVHSVTEFYRDSYS